jgi:hypothetical protein
VSDRLTSDRTKIYSGGIEKDAGPGIAQNKNI